MSTVHSPTAGPTPSTAALPAASEVPHDIGDVQIAPADGVHGQVGLYAVTVGGHTRYMSRQDALDLMHVLTPVLDLDDPHTAEAMQGRSVVGQAGGFAVAVAMPAPGRPPSAPPAAPPAAPKVVQGSNDGVVTGFARDMGQATGHDVIGLGKGSLAGVEEVTLVAHGTTSIMEMGPKEIPTPPRQLAQQLVDAGWRGGTVRLASCNTGAGGAQSYGQQLANALSELGAESAVIAPQAEAAMVHGIPRVADSVIGPNGHPLAQPKGQGWDVFVAEDRPGWQLDRSALNPGAWKGAALGSLKFAATIALSYIHSAAVQKRMHEEAARTGWADGGPTGNRLYDLGAWLLDPTNEAARSMPFSQRFDMDKWRATMKHAADAKAPGDYYRCTWTTSDGYDVLGTPKERTFDATYRKGADGTWRTVSCKGCQDGEVPPDLNRIIDPKVSNEEIRKYLELPEPGGGLA
jgi:hypothetical protein